MGYAEANIERVQLVTEIVHMVLSDQHIDFTDLKYQLLGNSTEMAYSILQPVEKLRTDQ